MKRYDTYKDSGVEWIGEIPTNWKKGRLKNYFNLSSGKNPSDLDKEFGQFPVYGSNGIIGYTNNPDLNKETILIGRVGSSGELNLNKFPCSVSDNCLVVELKENHSLMFVYYLLIKTELKNYTTKTSQPLITGSTIREIDTIIPPLSEQQQIVSFLDTKTSLIDSLIEKTQRKIELLKEKRTSLINEVVTKGLNPNVEMKDSGVEWIGEIPSHWLFTKFNRFVFFQEGPGLRTFQFTDEGTKVICVTNITEKGIDFTYKKFISTDEYFEKYQHFTVEKGDYLLSSSGNSWGKVSEYHDDEKVMLNTSTIRLNTIDSSIYNKSLIPHILKSEVVRKQLEILMTGSCQPNFGPSHLNQLVIPIPPLSEQQQIIEYLDEQTELIDKTVSIEEKRIELLKEYRQSLISEVVTGKLKVTTDE